ncbi:unnamed protein product [Orchesella dallaii]|uniref:Uncharacterized protein n=1 Tax=Orchesella dallaii TaxID=48710 RepID=A0ABP1RRB5_9HEXA
MALPKSSFPTHEFKVLTAEESVEACYPIASTTDTTSVYFQESNAEVEVDYSTTNNTDLNSTMGINSLQGSYFKENSNLTSRSTHTPRNQGIELMPTNLRKRNRGIKIATSTPLLPNETRMGSLESPKPSRAPGILGGDSPSASPGQKLARFRTKRKVEVQTISLSSSPSPSSPGTPLIPYPPPNTPVTRVRLNEHFSTQEFLDQLLDGKTVDWQCVKDETTQKYHLEFSKTN